MRYDEILYEQFLQDTEKVEKYQKVGIYSISIEGQLVYIGKSANMLKRISSHMSHIQKPYCNESYQRKYELIRKALKQGYRIQFDVIEYVYSPSLLDEAEGRHIREKLPPLNTQIPKVGSKGFTINKQAKYITLEEIIENGKKEI